MINSLINEPGTMVSIGGRSFVIGHVYQGRSGKPRELVAFEDYNTPLHSGNVMWRHVGSEMTRTCWCSTWLGWVISEAKE